MPGIRVDTPVGDGWEYTFDNVTWQTSNVFRNFQGQPFLEGATYTVNCRNLVTNEKATNSIIYRTPTNSTSNPPGLDDVLNVSTTSDIAPFLKGGLSAILPAAPQNEIIQHVGVGADGRFYLLDSSPLDELDTTEKKDAFLRDLLNAMSPQTHTILCELNASCPAPPVVIAPILDQFDHYEFVPNESGQLAPALDQFAHFEFVPNGVVVVVPPTLDPLYMVRLDGNNCGVNGNYGVVDGWVIDLNHPNDVQSVRIKRDGVFRADVVATIDRPDVRDYLIAQGLIPASTTFARYGYSYAKLQEDSDGKAHEWSIYGGTSATEAISDTGAMNTLTCGSVSPTIIQQVIGGVISLYEAEEGIVWVNNNFSNGSQGFYIGDGTFVFDAPYPNGVTITMLPNARGRIKVPADCTDKDVTRPLRFVFPDGRSIPVDFTFKNIATADPNANPASHDDMVDFRGNDFSVELGTTPAPGYIATQHTGGIWNWSGGTLCQTETSASADQRLMYNTEANGLSSYNHTITVAKVKPVVINGDSRIGIGLRYEMGGSYPGYCFVIKDTSQVWFIHNGVEGGPAFSYPTQVGTWYWMKMSYLETANNTCKLSAKIWKAGEVEPTAYMFFWENQPRKNGYPVLVGGFNDSKACFDDWYDGNLPGTTPPNVATGGDSSIGSVAIWRENSDQVWFLYKSNQPGNQGLEDNWPPGTLNVMGNTTDFLPSLYSTGQRPAGYESYQYLDGYGSMSADMLTALQSPSTLTIRKATGKAIVLALRFTAKNLAKGEVRTLYTL